MGDYTQETTYKYVGREVVRMVEITVQDMLVEVASTQQQQCHMLAGGWAITHRRRPTSMLAEAQVSSGYFRSQQRPDPIIVFVSLSRCAWGFFYCCLCCIICSHQ